MKDKANGAGTKDWEKATKSLRITSVVPGMYGSRGEVSRANQKDFTREDFGRALESASRRVSESDSEKSGT